MTFNSKGPKIRPRYSSKSPTYVSYQTAGQTSQNFTDLFDLFGAFANPRFGYHAEIFYNGGVKIWSILGNHRFTLSYGPDHIKFESLKKRSAGGEWVPLNPEYDSWTPGAQSQDVQFIFYILKNSPVTTLSRENPAQQNSLITSSAFPLAQTYETFSRVKLYLIDASRDHNWRPALILSRIQRQKLNHTRQDTSQQDQDVVMADVADISVTVHPRLNAFLDREEAAIKAEQVDGKAIAAAVKAIRAASPTLVPKITGQLPITPILVGEEEAIRDIIPFAPRDYLVDFSYLDEINSSQRGAVQNVFDYQVSLIHAPAGCGQVATIVSATEAILRKSPKTKILICSVSNGAADTIAAGFKTREHLCSFRFGYFRFLPRMEEDLQDTRVVICTYAASGVEPLTENWCPQVLLASNAGMLRHYELIVPLATYLDSLTRLVLVGDYIRHGPAAATEAGQTAWKESIFETMMKGRWPKQILNVNYSTHADLWYPTNLVFYQNRVTAARKTADPGPFLTHVLHKVRTGLQIRDSDGGVATISSFAHFVDTRNTQDDSIEPEVDCVEVLVKALLSTGACDASQMMVVCGARDYQERLTLKSTSHGWSDVTVENTVSVQDLSRQIVILCLPRSEHGLNSSPMSQRRNVSVMMSLATEVCYIVGTWKAVCLLDHTNDLQRILFNMTETVDDFLLRVGRGPYEFQNQGVATA